MTKKGYIILILSCICIIGLSVGITAKLYTDKINQQFGKLQIAELEYNISDLKIDIDQETAIRNQLQEQLNSKNQIIATLSGELSLAEAKHKEIKTAIYYLNKSLGIDQK